MNIIERLFSSDNVYFATILGAIGVILKYKSLQNDKHHSINMDRLEAIIHPLFETAEIYMERSPAPINSLQIEEWIEIISSNSLLAGGVLREFKVALLRQAQKPNIKTVEFDKFFSYLSKEYDRLCHLSGIPLRKWSYRISHYRLKFSYGSLFNLFLVVVFQLVCMLLALLIIMTRFTLALASIQSGTVTSADVITVILTSIVVVIIFKSQSGK